MTDSLPALRLLIVRASAFPDLQVAEFRLFRATPEVGDPEFCNITFDFLNVAGPE